MTPESADQAMRPLSTAALSRHSWREVSGGEREALLQLLVETRKRVLLFVSHLSDDVAQESGQQSVVLKFDVEGSRITVSATRSRTFDQRLVQLGGVLVVELDEGRLQVDLHDIGKRALPNWQLGLSARVADPVLLIQRRGARRVINCSDIQFQLPAEISNPQQDIEVEDLSDQGVGFSLSGGFQPLTVGQSLQGCQLSLPNGAVVELDAQVRGVDHKVTAEGVPYQLVGAIFVDLPANVRALIQRYTFRCDLHARNRAGAVRNLDRSLSHEVN